MIGIFGGRLHVFALAAATVLAASVAAAQEPAPGAPAGPPDAANQGGPDGSGTGQHQHRRGLADRHAGQAAPPPIKIVAAPWPRLDPGAVLCRTAEDLNQHLAAIEARLDGNNAVHEPAGCTVVQAPTAVVVLDRSGPAQTEVRLSQTPGQTGWTDAFLPDKQVVR